MSNQTVDHSLQKEVTALRAVKAFHESLTNVYKKRDVLLALSQTIAQQMNEVRIGIFTYDAENVSLDLQACFPYLPGIRKPSGSIILSDLDEESILHGLAEGTVIDLKNTLNESKLNVVHDLFPEKHGRLVPLIIENQIIGLLICLREEELNSDHSNILNALIPGIGSALNTAQQHSLLKKRMNQIEQQSEIFHQIDEELSNIIELNYVFTMIMDWALRFTNADAAGLALYDHENDTLRFTSQYGYREGALPIGQELGAETRGIAYRVAQSGQAEITPDVQADEDYVPIADGIRTQMTVPIMRDQRVIAVIALESKRTSGFTDEHLKFVRQLTSRAGIALDNARLFEETKREREKLSHILRTITNIVIVVGSDGRIVLINDTALLSFHLSIEHRYEGLFMSEVIPNKALQELYQDSLESGEESSGEVELPNKRTYYAHITPHPAIGHMVVLQDITHFKETDRLKTELVATVSHDLKQPLSVMRGYLDLLHMVNDFDQRSTGYMNNLEYAFGNMRQLIDDLLDIANIESGIQLDLSELDITDVLQRVLRNNDPNASKKSIAVSLRMPEKAPAISGDAARLEQIFNNLLGNAIKYTPPDGRVNMNVEVRENDLRVVVEDTGMGIGPEDQSQIFERFYRVRRPETDGIEGTGLGLAIVKSLIEAHGGKIDLRSSLGQGSTFRVTLPVA